MTQAAPGRRGEFGRRDFLRAATAAGTGLAAWSILGQRAGWAAAATRTGPATTTVPLNTGWLFGGVATPGSTAPGANDSGYAQVTVPHCAVPLGWRNWDYSTWEKVWIYRRHFDAPAASTRMRTFADFSGVLTSATPTFNGHTMPTHQGGYLPFSHELTDHLIAKDNVLALDVDATWQNVPPEGNPRGAPSVDYFEPGGLYRDVRLRVVPQIFIADLFAKPVNVLESSRQIQAQCTIDAAVVPSGPVELEVVLSDGARPVARNSAKVPVSKPGQVTVTVGLSNLGNVQLWSPDSPHLYQVTATLLVNGQPIHNHAQRIGLRDAVFDVDGFFLNGNRLKLFGLNRHQVYPWAGMSMPGRVQRHDALILKQQLNCNMVRCSHYPQSPYFLDACDELGIMVWEETPGWGYLGDSAFQALVVQNVHDMVVRDRNRPSIVLWGVQVNESRRDPALYTQTKDLANSLDGTRQTSGSNTAWNLTNWVQEVFAMDDYSHSGDNAQLHPPLPNVPYLVTEAVGALDWAPFYRRTDSQNVLQGQARAHAQVHNIAASSNGYAGLLGWCAFDYDSLAGNTDQHMKWPGVADTFRVLKPGAAFYQAQRDPTVPVIEPAFYWDFGPVSPVTSLGSTATIWSNCDRIEAYVDNMHVASLTPDTTGFPHLAHPPFHLDVSKVDGSRLPELRLDGYVGSRLALSRSFASDPSGDRLQVTADDTELDADGSDATRVVFRAVDRYGAPRPYATGVVSVAVDGPGTYLGELAALSVQADTELLSPGQQATVKATLSNAAFPFGDNGGVGAVYVRTLTAAPGVITVTVSHPTLGSGKVTITSVASGTTAVPPSPAPSQALTGVKLALAAPTGWKVQALSGTSASQLEPGRSLAASWRVTAPGSVAGGASTAVTAGATFQCLGQQASSQKLAPLYLAQPLQDAFDNTGISDDSDTKAANFDGKGRSYSQQALTAAGLAPGAVVSHKGIRFTWPDVAAGHPDNALAGGHHTVQLSGTGSTLGFLGAGTGNALATGKVFYTDGSSGDFQVMLYHWEGEPGPENDIVAAMSYLNTAGGQAKHAAYVFYASAPIDPGKTVKAVTLLNGGYVQYDATNVRGAHIFAIGVG